MRKLVGILSLIMLAGCHTPPDSTGCPARLQPLDTGADLMQQAAPVAAIPNTVYFGYDSSLLDQPDWTVLEQQAEWIKAHPQVQVIIEGHCDERGTREYNIGLGERRANSAKDYLTSLGVAESRIRVISYGKERPSAEGTGENIWWQNRRAVVVHQ